MIRLVAVACGLAFLLPGAAVAHAVSAPTPDRPERPAPPRNCRVLAQQPSVDPSRPASGTMTLVVLMPATTCNTR